jgi:hypothetical protein
LFEAVGVVFDVDVANRSFSLGIVLTGCHGVRSSVFSVDQDFVNHERIISEVHRRNITSTLGFSATSSVAEKPPLPLLLRVSARHEMSF